MAAGVSTRNRATMEKSSLFLKKNQEKSSLLLKLKACAGQRVTLFERLDWKTPCLMHTLANQLRPSQKDTWAFYASGHNQKLAQFISEIRVERSLSMFCTNCHKIDITTGYCSWVEIHPYKKKQYQYNLVCFTDT